VVCFRKPVDAAALEDVRELVKRVGEVVKEGCGYGWDGVALAVALPQGISPCLELGDEWEDWCQDLGFEFVDWEKKGRNEFGGMYCAG
jgi:hypothetical protein